MPLYTKPAFLYKVAASFILCLGLTACTTLDAGCLSYSIERLNMPDSPVPETAWGEWIADTDDRMTGTCT